MSNTTGPATDRTAPTTETSGIEEVRSYLTLFGPIGMIDDFGVFPAEMIRMHLEGNEEAIPLIASGEIVLVDHRMSEDEIAELTEYAFRYSGVTDR